MAKNGLLILLIVGLFPPQWGNETAEIQVCIDSFVVHADKIIRTQDSRALGAKYLTEGEVATRDDCLQLCCQTLTCDVFIYEHKRRGSCYLFHCGDPQDFKCKFTQHRNYSSGVLMPANELEAQIKLTKHEKELTQLSGKVEQVALPAITTTVPTMVTEKSPQTVKENITTRSECSRYQFECKSTRECIAIYNACDGIAQCPDGSDEGPELDCPTLSGGTARPGQNAHHNKQLPVPIDVHTAADVKKSYPEQQLPVFPSYGNNEKQETLQALEAQQQLLSQVKSYGREGEGATDAWRGYAGQPRKPADEKSRIFSHKGGLVPEGDSGPMTQYGTDGSGRGDYTKSGSYYGANSYPSYNWPPRQRDDPRWMYPGPPPPSDYYYEEAQMRARLPPVQNDQRLPVPAPPAEAQDSQIASKPVLPPVPPQPPKDAEKNTLTKVEEGKTKDKETASVKKVIVESVAATKAPAPTKSAQSQGLVMNEDDAIVIDVDEENETPRGAILSLALGMCIAAIMITLVGCRLRVVQRRLRRGGKAGYAHDADFLVNGMYL